MHGLTALADDEKLQFAESLLKALEPRPFGTPSKTELEGFLYDALVRAKYVTDDDGIFAAATKLQVSPARVNGYRYSARLREIDPTKRIQGLARAVEVVLSTTSGDRIVLHVEDRYWRDLLEAQLKAQGVYVDYSFNRQRLVLESADATSRLLRVFGDAGRRVDDELQQARIRAKKKQFGDLFADLVKKSAAAAGKQVGMAMATGGVVAMSTLLGLPSS